MPPTWRAYAQLKRQVRTIPTCGVPVGEGQKRTRILSAAIEVFMMSLGYRRFLLLRYNGVAQCADAVNVCFNFRAWPGWDSGRYGTSEDDISRQKCEAG